MNSTGDNPIERVEQILRESKYKDMPRIQDICKVVFVSPSWLSKRWALTHEETMQEYHMRLRMEAAMELISKEFLLLKEYAFRMGYNHEPIFGQHFKEWNQISLSDARKKFHGK